MLKRLHASDDDGQQLEFKLLLWSVDSFSLYHFLVCNNDQEKFIICDKEKNNSQRHAC